MQSIPIANWKENGTLAEAQAWIEKFSQEQSVLANTNVIVCPPFTLLQFISEQSKKVGLPISVGAQDISRFEEGKHTGEVSPKMVAEFASYVIIGHSERRSDFDETNEIVAEKIALAKKHTLTPIVCISEISEVEALKKLSHSFSGIIAYEPLFAVGTGNPDTPENANAMAERIKKIFPDVHVLYGGSVDGSNARSFFTQTHINGALIGNRSLDPSFFLEIVFACKQAH